jgi:hypothetical protein
MSHVLPPGSRIGLIAEGAPDLEVVADLITRLVRPDLRLLPEHRRRLAPKPELLRQAPAVAAALLEGGCAHVAILWDSAPFGCTKNAPQDDLTRFWRECDELDHQRKASGEPPLDRTALCPVPVVRELESWLLADERALSAYLSTPSHPVPIGRIPRPQREPNPKKTLKRLFEAEGKRSAYMDYLDAAPLARQVRDLARLRKLSSFQELMTNVGVPAS